MRTVIGLEPLDRALSEDDLSAASTRLKAAGYRLRKRPDRTSLRDHHSRTAGAIAACAAHLGVREASFLPPAEP